MAAPFSTVATGVVSISLLHSLVPHHWLPFVAVGKRQGWTGKKTLGVLSLGAVVHTLSTIMVGVLVGLLGHQIDRHFETFHGVVPGLVLIAFGSGYILSSFRHFHHEVSDKIAASTLILMLGLSPCVVVAPFFLILGPMGISAIIKVSLVMAILSVAGMTLLGWLAMHGLNFLKLEWLETNESRIMGIVLMFLGVSFLII
jgi:nickel/cobalt transporter (NicO) family protein